MIQITIGLVVIAALFLILAHEGLTDLFTKILFIASIVLMAYTIGTFIQMAVSW